MLGIERELQRKVNEHLKGIRKAVVNDIFKDRYYIGPEDLKMTNYVRTRPLAIFNPAAVEKEGRIFIFPRLIFDYYKYTSSVGVFSIDSNNVIAGKIDKPIDTKIILWPQELWEFLGCEDPRACIVNGDLYMLYTGKGYYYDEHGKERRRDVLGFVELDSSFGLKRKGYFIVKKGDEEFMPVSNKDSAFIEIRGNRATLLTRPEIQGVRACWRAEANLKTLTFFADSLEPVLVPEEWEQKVGWSTNTVKVSEDEYLVGWHAVLKEDWSYRDGLALVNGKGKLLAVSDYLLVPTGLKEEYGDRELVIFGDGLVKLEDHLIWIGGVSDYCVGIFVADMRDVMSSLRRIK